MSDLFDEGDEAYKQKDFVLTAPMSFEII